MFYSSEANEQIGAQFRRVHSVCKTEDAFD
jgi:hypothetical protein